MNTIHSPSKVQVRAYLARRVNEHTPPPSLADVRRQLGWELTPSALRGLHGR